MSCVLPWIHLATAPAGTLRQCCVIDQNFIPKKSNGKPYRLDRPGDIEKYWNSSEMRDLRLSLLADKKPKSCQRCWTEEESGIKSMRQSFNSTFSDEYQKLTENTTDNGSTKLRPIYLDLRFGNLCNLKCRMCGPYSSDRFLDEWNLANPDEALSKEELLRLSRLNWWDNPRVWEELSSYLEEVELVYSTGGEPTLAEGFYRFMDLCIEKAVASNITIKINTNLTNFPNRLVEKLEKFKKVRLNLSIDAVGPLARYVRHPSDWNTIEKNLKKVDQLSFERNWDSKIQTTVQAITVTRLDDLFDNVKQFKSICKFPSLNILDHPHYLNIRVLPKSLKEKVAEKLTRYYEDHKTEFLLSKEKSFFENLPLIINYMFVEDRSDLLPTLAKHTYQLDLLRDEKLADVLPELDEILNNYR